MYAGKPQPEINDLITACVELAKINRATLTIAICHLRLLLAHITKDESLALSHRVAEIDGSFTGWLKIQCITLKPEESSWK